MQTRTCRNKKDRDAEQNLKIASLSPPSIFLRSHSQFSKKMCIPMQAYYISYLFWIIFFWNSSNHKKSIYFCRSLVSSQDENDANCYFFVLVHHPIIFNMRTWYDATKTPLFKNAHCCHCNNNRRMTDSSTHYLIIND